MSDTASFRRNPLVISGNSLSSGDRSTTFTSGSPSALLRSYLIFVRDMRGQRREPSIELRSEDVSVLALHLGVSEEYVLGGLLDLMGATRAQRSTMMAMLAAGALTIVLTGSFVSDLSTDGVSVELSRLADAVQSAAAGSDAASDTPTAAPVPAATSRTAAPERAAAVAESSPAAATTADPEVAAPAVAGAATESLRTASLADTARSALSASVSRGTDAGVAEVAAPATQPGQVAGEPVSIGVAPDGSIVASVAPPVPAAAPDEPVATAELPDGTTVGVAAPPVPAPPPAEQVATAELPDGTTVGVAAPPVPPTPSD